MNIWVDEVSPRSAVTGVEPSGVDPEVHVHAGLVVTGQVAHQRVVARLHVRIVTIWEAPGFSEAPVSTTTGPGLVLVDLVRVALEAGDRVVRRPGCRSGSPTSSCSIVVEALVMMKLTGPAGA